MRVANRKTALRRNRIELIGVDVLEYCWEKIEPVPARILLDLALHRDELRRQIRCFNASHRIRSTGRTDNPVRQHSGFRTDRVVRPTRYAAASTQNRDGVNSRITSYSRGKSRAICIRARRIASSASRALIRTAQCPTRTKKLCSGSSYMVICVPSTER